MGKRQDKRQPTISTTPGWISGIVHIQRKMDTEVKCQKPCLDIDFGKGSEAIR